MPRRNAGPETHVSLLRTQIERIVEPSFRRTRHAIFQRPDGWYICDAWFEGGEPRMQIRSSAHTLEEAAIVAQGIHMAINWLIEETSRGGNVPPQTVPVPDTKDIHE
jgi:hypothetical protein